MRTVKHLSRLALLGIWVFGYLGISHAQDLPGTVVAARITTGSTNNTFSIGDTDEMKGTPKSVTSLLARDDIALARRNEGMECWVTTNATLYRLLGGIANANWVVVTNASSGDSLWSASGSDAYRSTGNVGIGTSPDYRLHVLATSGASAYLQNTTANPLLYVGEGTGASQYGILGWNLAANYTFLDSQGSTPLVLQSGVEGVGNVGIGTVTPLASLHVAGTNSPIGGDYNTYGNLFVASTDALAADKGGSIALGGVGNVGGVLTYTFAKISGRKDNSTGGSTAGYLAFETDYSSASLVERMRITSAGNVGIGTPSPDEELEVNGNVLADGFSSDGINFVQVPTNAPVNGYKWTATGTSGAGAWAADATGSSPNQTDTISVLDHGAVPYVHNNNSIPVSLSITDYTTQIQNAINSASNSFGHSNVVYFPVGIFRITNTLWVPKNVKLRGEGQFFDQMMAHSDSKTNNYSMIWRTGGGDGVVFFEASGENSIENISIHGATNPVVNNVSIPSSAFGNIGLRAYHEDATWCQNFSAERVSITGFRVGIWNENNNSYWDRVRAMGCDVGYLSATTNYYQDLVSSGLGYFTNLLNLATNRDGTRRTEFVRGEQSVLNLPWFGERTNSLCYFLGGTRSLTILQDSSYSFSEYAWLLDSYAEVLGAQWELDYYAGTNFVKAFGASSTFNVIGAYLNVAPPSGQWCMIRSFANGFFGSLDACTIVAPNFAATEEPLLLEYQKNTQAELRNTASRGITRLIGVGDYYYQRNDARTLFNEFGQFQLRNPVYGLADLLATNMLHQIGRVGIQHSGYATHDDYISGVMWYGNGTGFDPRFFRVLTSDPDTAQQVADRGNVINTNFTVGNLVATGTNRAGYFIGNGAGLTNLPGGSGGATNGIQQLDGFGTNTQFYSTAYNAGTQVYDAETGFFYSADDHALRVDLEEGELFHGGSVRLHWGNRALNGDWSADSNFTVTGDLSGGANLILPKTITAAGTTGAQTIDKVSGRVNFAAAAQTLVVTDSLVDANSVITCSVGTDDNTAKSCIAVPAAGSFTLKLNAAATAETSVYFRINN